MAVSTQDVTNPVSLPSSSSYCT